MDDQKLQLILDHIDLKVDPIKEDIRELKADVKELTRFKWKVTGIVIAAGSGTGLLGFSLAKFLDKVF